MKQRIRLASLLALFPLAAGSVGLTASAQEAAPATPPAPSTETPESVGEPRPGGDVRSLDPAERTARREEFFQRLQERRGGSERGATRPVASLSTRRRLSIATVCSDSR